MIMDYGIMAYLFNNETSVALQESFLYTSLYTHSHLRRKRCGRHERIFLFTRIKNVCNHSCVVAFNRTEEWY